MIWSEEEREQRIKEIKEYLSGNHFVIMPNAFPKTEMSDEITAKAWEETKQDLLDRIIKDENGNWIGLMYTHTMPDIEKMIIDEINGQIDEYDN